jgi:hypothetical protein
LTTEIAPPPQSKRISGKSPNGDQQAAETKRQGAAMPQSAAAPSPFTPTVNYGFLSNWHTGALAGEIDWLGVPRFDSPSVLGTLLDRGAGSFRIGPFGINVPSDRVYEPGTNTLFKYRRADRLGDRSPVPPSLGAPPPPSIDSL